MFEIVRVQQKTAQTMGLMRFVKTTLTAALAATLLCVTSFIPRAEAQGIALVRDSEIEHTIRSYVDPIFKAAGLDPRSITLYLVNDPNINAFVAEGQNLFLNTGTILRLDRPRELIGILAHETGHIAGGHLVRSAAAIDAATVPLIVGTLLGIAAAAGGAGEAGIGIMGGGQEIAQRSLYAFTRGQESSADQAAVTFLDRTHQSARGLLETFQLFAGQEVLSAERMDPYIQTHPLSRERIAALENRIAESPYADVKETPEQIKSFFRMKAKLYGFMMRLDQVLRKYPESDQSIDARYARAIAHYRVPDLKLAVKEVDGLIQDEPNNPYFHELKGQILFENGYAAQAVPEYADSVRLLPDEPLLGVSYGQALLATERPADVKPAIAVLERALRDDPTNALGWRQLAIGYARDNRIAMAELATAERLALGGGRGMMEAAQHAVVAACGLEKGSPSWQRAMDIVDAARNNGGRGRSNGNPDQPPPPSDSLRCDGVSGG